jgi:A/G-specific adenine glycosylase
MTAAVMLGAHWDATWDARRLPWRTDTSYVRQTLVEGLLAQTTAASVARWYDQIFMGIESAADWLRLAPSAQTARVAPLGLPRLKVAAVTSIASALDLYAPNGRLCDDGIDALRAAKGIGPYTLGMVALLHGHEAAPVDCNVQRVGARADASGNPDTWIAEVMADAIATERFAAYTGSHPRTSPFPRGYEVICAILDVGSRICSVTSPDCLRCPLYGDGAAHALCASAPKIAHQLLLSV